MITILVPALVGIIGLLVYALASPNNPKASEIGRILFFAGTLVVLLVVAREVVKL